MGVGRHTHRPFGPCQTEHKKNRFKIGLERVGKGAGSAWAFEGQGKGMGLDIKHYQPPGPVAAAFIQSRGPIDLIMGPGGSGKTVASVIKGPRHAAEYAPHDRNGWIRVKTLCLRDTYRSFAATALASWYNMFPQNHPWTYSHEGGQDRPVKHVLRWKVRRGSVELNAEYTMETGAIGDNNLEQFFKGYEVTYGWMNECDILHENVPGLLFQRTGRFPEVHTLADSEIERVSRDGRKMMDVMGLSYEPHEVVLPRIVWGDYNPPDLDNWAVKVPIEEKRPGYNHFWQPGGLESTAENRVGKPRSSYELELATTTDEQLARRMIHGQPGYSRDGKPVYPEFNLKLHVADQAITPIRNLPIYIGIDGGGTPSAVIIQPTAEGFLLVLDEVTGTTGPTSLSRALVELLLSKYRGFNIGSIFGDPANFYSPDTQAGDLSFMQIVGKALNKNITPAPSNEPTIRQEAVRYYLTRLVDNMRPALILDPNCRLLKGGFAAHYMLTKQSSEGGTDKMAVKKNPYSHPHDALQYACLGYRGGEAVIRDAAQMGRPANVVGIRQKQANTARDRTDFDIWNV